MEGFWFNPNIHPFTEYMNRLDSLKKLESIWDLDICYYDFYGLKDFLRKTINKEDERCYYCYTMRMEKTAQEARKKGINLFTTTLLYSRYQKYDMIIEVGKEIQDRYSVEFYTEDFRKGWHEGINMSKDLSLYRQKYCGCIYSEMERYVK